MCNPPLFESPDSSNASRVSDLRCEDAWTIVYL